MTTFHVPIEDELGDVLEKAMRHAGLNEEALAASARVPADRIRDAIDYRSELDPAEVRRLASALHLNEVGCCAMGCGMYPLPEIGALPFCLYPLHMTHGIGVANAYLVAETGSSRAVLFDLGPGDDALRAVWPPKITGVDAVLLTHLETEHPGGLCGGAARFGGAKIYCPAGAPVPCGIPMKDGASVAVGSIEITALATPGHASAHNCYSVRSRLAKTGRALLVSGDLLFAGSVGGGYHCPRELRKHLLRVLGLLPPDSVIAPGHGPLTTVENEKRYNPFIV